MKIQTEELKHPFQLFLRHYRFRRGLAKLISLPLGEIPNRELLNDLSVGWGNLAYSADLNYLAEVAQRSVRTVGNVLECGSGLTTLILAVLVARRGKEVHSLEHHPLWHGRVLDVLKEIGNMNVHLHLAP